MICILDIHTAGVVLDYLGSGGLDVETCIRKGQLSIIKSGDTYLVDGVFDPEKMISLLRMETERALAEGYPGLRVTGEMAWMLRGIKAATAANGGEALLMVEEGGLKPDLVITDVVLPGMSGNVLVERLRRSLPDLKVLYMSGYTDNAIVHRGVLDPGTPFIQKPFSFKDLAIRVKSILRGV